MRTQSWLKSLNSKLIRFLNLVVSAGIYFMAVTLMLQVGARYLFGESLAWSEELARYTLIWASMLGAVAVLDVGDFIAFRAFANQLGSRLRKSLDILAKLSTIGFFVVLVWYGFQITLMNLGQLSPALYWPIGYIYASMPVAGVLILIRLVFRLVMDPRHHDSDVII